MKIRPVILSGGSGTRLWPLSRSLYPKQFIPFGDTTLFELALMRALAMPEAADPLVLAGHEQRFMAAELLRKHGLLGQDAAPGKKAALILEPAGRNTAPAIAVAALAALEEGEDPLLLVLPSDHLMQSLASFSSAVGKAAVAAERGSLMTFGITPDHPATGYGYITLGEERDGAFTLVSFVEKPDTARAADLIESGALWNSGMFLFRAGTILEELERFNPGLVEAAAAAWRGRKPDLDFIRLDKEAFLQTPSISIDYAVMEKTGRAAAVPLDTGWNDLGSWESFYASSGKDAHGNAVKGDVMLLDSSNTYVHASSRLVAAIGLQDLILVESPDAVLVARQGRSQEVREILAELKKKGRPEADAHIRVLRPWGSYETLALADRFQVKRIILKPGKAISLQLHHHRAEHWVVVRGTAKVLLEENGALQEHILGEDMSVYVPLGAKHLLTNPGQLDLELIEVQTGSYLGEDDIVRFADMFGRDA